MVRHVTGGGSCPEHKWTERTGPSNDDRRLTGGRFVDRPPSCIGNHSSLVISGAEKDGGVTMGVSSMVECMRHAGFVVGDLERSIAFYRDALGFDLLLKVDRFEDDVAKGTGVPGAKIRAALLQLGESQIELIQYVQPKGKGYDRRNCDVGVAHLAFLVTDIDGVYEELSKSGVHFSGPPARIAEGARKGWAWVYFSDPDGFQIEISQAPQDG